MTTLHLPLTADDRCDACGARAALVFALNVEVPGSGELGMCGHHAEKHKDAILAKAVIVWDAHGKVVFDRTSLTVS
jgi:hypothetical protein